MCSAQDSHPATSPPPSLSPSLPSSSLSLQCHGEDQTCEDGHLMFGCRLIGSNGTALLFTTHEHIHGNTNTYKCVCMWQVSFQRQRGRSGGRGGRRGEMERYETNTNTQVPHSTQAHGGAKTHNKRISSRKFATPHSAQTHLFRQGVGGNGDSSSVVSLRVTCLLNH